MAQDAEPVVGLYDFLYRDTNRLISYYSQIFQGRLASIEESEDNKESSQKTGGVNVQVASSEYKKTNEDNLSSKRIFDPHDMNTTDVLTYLDDNGFIGRDCAAAPNGSLFLAKGKIFFIDSQLIKSTSTIFTLMISQGVIVVEDPNAVVGVQVLNNLLEGVPFPPIYFLETESGDIISGVVKESGMEELVSTYYFRYGQNALPNVYLLALKETPEPLAPTSVSVFLKASHTLTAGISQLLFPNEPIKATPLAMFRKFEPI